MLYCFDNEKCDMAAMQHSGTNNTYWTRQEAVTIVWNLDDFSQNTAT